MVCLNVSSQQIIVIIIIQTHLITLPMQVSQMFPKGVLYLIVCKGNELALKIENTQNHNNSCVVSIKPNFQDLSQLWLVQQIKTNDYEVVNALSDFCFDQESGEIHLKKGKQASDQLFYIERSPVEEYHPYYWIKTYKNSKKALVLEEVLKYKDFVSSDPYQLFRFEPIGDGNTIINKTTILINLKSGKVLDVPSSSNQQGERLIQWTRNGRFNQRWNFIKTGKVFQIQSFKNGMNVDIAGESRKSGAKIIQWAATGASNQLWSLENKGSGLFIIRSVHEPTLMLGVDGESVADGGKISTVSNETLWRLEGYIPV